MRFALLGETNPGPLRQSVQWVHENFFEALRTALNDAPSNGETESRVVLSDSARCVYAAMDYHLDWLHAALATSHVAASTGEASGLGRRLRMAERLEEHGIEKVQHDVMGTLEDIDLALVIEDGAMTYLVLIEAKGDSSFSRSQLASKLSRLKLILDSKHAPQPELLRCAFVLMAPEDKLKLGKSVRYADLAKLGKPVSTQTLDALSDPPARLGEVIIRMPMSNYPDTLDLVKRCESGDEPGAFVGLTHWTIEPRRRAESTDRKDASTH